MCCMSRNSVQHSLKFTNPVNTEDKFRKTGVYQSTNPDRKENTSVKLERVLEKKKT